MQEQALELLRVFGLDEEAELTVLNFGRVLCQGKTSEVLNNPDVVKAYLGE